MICLKVLSRFQPTSLGFRLCRILNIAHHFVSSVYRAEGGSVALVAGNNNNNNSHDNVYGAVIMTKVIARVLPVHLMNVD